MTPTGSNAECQVGVLKYRSLSGRITRDSGLIPVETQAWSAWGHLAFDDHSGLGEYCARNVKPFDHMSGWSDGHYMRARFHEYVARDREPSSVSEACGRHPPCDAADLHKIRHCMV